MKQCDVIYLQTDNEAELHDYEGVAWCRDQINDDDTKYLLATPVREAADELLGACRLSSRSMGLLWEFRNVLPKIEAAIALATTEVEDAD